MSQGLCGLAVNQSRVQAHHFAGHLLVLASFHILDTKLTVKQARPLTRWAAFLYYYDALDGHTTCLGAGPWIGTHSKRNPEGVLCTCQGGGGGGGLPCAFSRPDLFQEQNLIVSAKSDVLAPTH
jgi:hypothetical protein